MSIDINPIAPTTVWWVTTTDDLSVIRNGVTDGGLHTTFGQPNVELFDNEVDYLARLEELGVDVSEVN